MKWFKHESTFNNPKIKLLKRKHGAIGYAVYFQIVELIGDNIQKDNKLEWGYLPKEYTQHLDFLSMELGTDIPTLDAILATCYELNLLENRDGDIFCNKILERCDDYTERLLKGSSTKSEQSKDKVEQSTPRIEENRTEKNRKEKEEIRITGVRPEKRTGMKPIKEILTAHTPSPDNGDSRISYEWQDKASRYKEKLGLTLGFHATQRFFKCFKEAKDRGKEANLEQALSYLVDYPKPLSNEQKLLFFFKIYENGLQKFGEVEK